MKISTVGDESHKLSDILKPHQGRFELVEKDPEYVFAFGGDGTLMRAEALYPTVPKLLIRNSARAKLAAQQTKEETLNAFFKGTFETERHIKLSVSVNSEKKGDALNDVVIHNANPRHAIRYKIYIDDYQLHEEVVGDGVVCATPLGSTGYYRSITDSCFETGIGLAFNNSIEQTDHIVLKEDSVIRVEIIRGPGFCYLDNQEDSFTLDPTDTVEIRKSADIASIVSIGNGRFVA